MWSFAIIYQLLLSLAHNLFKIGCAIHNKYLWAASLFKDHEVIKAECIDNLFKKLNKIPQHLSLILGAEQPSFKDLINVIMWCTTSGIPFVSFYDHKGVLKEREEEFYKMVTEVSGLEYNNGYWMKVEAPYNGYKSEFTRKIRIKLYDLEDGQHDITLKVKEFIGLNKNSDDIDIDKLDNFIKKSSGNIPDPELIIYCGNLCSTYGFHPWSIRITEFFGVDSHHNLTLEQFYNILKSYGKCEQRYGK